MCSTSIWENSLQGNNLEWASVIDFFFEFWVEHELNKRLVLLNLKLFESFGLWESSLNCFYVDVVITVVEFFYEAFF